MNTVLNVVPVEDLGDLPKVLLSQRGGNTVSFILFALNPFAFGFGEIPKSINSHRSALLHKLIVAARPVAGILLEEKECKAKSSDVIHSKFSLLSRSAQ